MKTITDSVLSVSIILAFLLIVVSWLDILLPKKYRIIDKLEQRIWNYLENLGEKALENNKEYKNKGVQK